ncbi:Nif11-like leader peptide family natural product precursor [Parasynechococcus sp.]|uniref:Nif11-like leader peptide family natural product precursor n=1 Tax=Parasynechococcus sp. TaxID=3101203 RepID=UPI003703A068
MANSELERFVQAIADDHGLATGIKTLDSHYDIVAYANIRGYSITLVEWGRYLAMDWLQTSDADLVSVHRTDPAHWSWAFRQLSRWRALLMDGAELEGMLGPADFAVTRNESVAQSASAPALTLMDADKDAALASFIQLVKTRPDLKDQVKSARNQDEVIGLAQAQGFAIDSLTLLRSWSQVSDFSKPTWFGWFDG